MKTFELTIQIRNNRLKSRRLALGLDQARFAKRARIDVGAYCSLETMRRSPFQADGTWRPIAVRLAKFHGVSLEELFPEEVCAIKTNRSAREIDVGEVREFLYVGPHAELPSIDEMVSQGELRDRLREVLDTLPPIEAHVLNLCFGLDGEGERTHDHIAKTMNLSRARIHQIKKKALMMIRGSCRSRLLKEFVEP